MKLLEVVIKPITPLGTPFKGDTLFGQIFWELIYDNNLCKLPLTEVIEEYLSGNPFLIVSSAYPIFKEDSHRFWLFKKPSLPLNLFTDFSELAETLTEDCKEPKGYVYFKNLKKANWIKCRDLKIELKLKNLFFYIGNGKPFSLKSKQIRNRIHRILGSTSTNFAPFEVENIWFDSELELSILVLFKEEVIDAEALKVIFERIGKIGFGRDASCGLGKFKVLKIREIKLPEKSQAVYNLSPFVPNQDAEELVEAYFNSFLRFGKHGGSLSGSTNPFKNLIIMIDEGAVIKTSVPTGPFIGKGLNKLSKVCGSTIHQGYSIVIPVEGLKV